MRVLYIVPKHDGAFGRFARINDIIKNCYRVGIEPVVSSKADKEKIESVDVIHITSSGLTSAYLPMKLVRRVNPSKPIIFGPNFPNAIEGLPKEYFNLRWLLKYFYERPVDTLCFRSDYDVLMFQGEYHRQMVSSRFDIKPSWFIFKTRVDTRVFHPMDISAGDGHDVVLGCVGRKGTSTLEEAVRYFDDPDIRLSISVKVAKNIPRLRMPEFYNSIDAFVSSSTFETSPTVIAEALACGTPVIASDIPPVRELVSSSENALLFTSWKPKMVEKLAQRIYEFWKDKERFKKRAMHLCGGYDIGEEMEHLANEYGGLVR